MIELTRVPDWRGRLNEFLNEVRRTPFAWSAFDCGPAFTGRAVEAVTGVDVCSAYRGQYASAGEAVRLVERAGFDDLADLVASILPEYEHPSQAKVGDIAAVKTDGPFGWSLGVVNGERIFVLHETGLVTVDFLTASRAFGVG